MARIELKYKGDRAKIREELGFDMPVRAKRKPKPKTGIQDQTESKGDDSNDDNAAEAGHENANTSYPPSDVNNTSVDLPQMGVTPSDATVTATSDDVTAKATSNIILKAAPEHASHLWIRIRGQESPFSTVILRYLQVDLSQANRLYRMLSMHQTP